ncbi:LysR family transcriptional regulator [Sporosarcina sp. ACRSL]|uniref:LysR family transcriptional regulator n=1 Tax=Sporosarcina sp. ACRSL TaxID=2918215 RepID=UPI001EF5016C|nr:LysR family transcriptional regulator [Sporosarcina sp. ACRSL]MCG7344057.1 LysR family transcriptional regulator [Sporosarcina sp. ACRSL]
MDEKDALILQYLYEDRVITKAAERLYITQPALSYRIQQIENRFGVKIAIKSGKGIKFTSEGEYLVSVAQKILIEIQNAKDHLTNMATEVQGTLKIGATSIFARYHLPYILKTFVDMYPKVLINVNTGQSPNIMEMLDNDKIHVAFIRGDYSWDGLKHQINEDGMSLISKSKIDLNELPSLQWIKYLPPSRAKKYEPNTLLEDEIKIWWYEKFNQPPINTMSFDSYDTCKVMVEQGLGYSFIPKIFLNDNDDFHVVDLIKKNGETVNRRSWLMYKENYAQLRVVNKFTDYIKSLKLPSSKNQLTEVEL